MEHSRMDNPETLTTLDTQDTRRRQTKQQQKYTAKQKTENMSNMDPTTNEGVNIGALQG